VRSDRPRAPVRVLERRRADVDPGAAGRQRRVQRGVVADAAGHLHRDVQAADHLGEQPAVLPPAEGGVEVDQVDPLGACRLPGQGGLEGVAVGRLAARCALHQADRLTAGDVDGGQQDQSRVGGHGRLLRSRARVTRTGRASRPSSAAAPRTQGSGVTSQTIACAAR